MCQFTSLLTEHFDSLSYGVTWLLSECDDKKAYIVNAIGKTVYLYSVVYASFESICIHRKLSSYTSSFEFVSIVWVTNKMNVIRLFHIDAVIYWCIIIRFHLLCIIMSHLKIWKSYVWTVDKEVNMKAMHLGINDPCLRFGSSENKPGKKIRFSYIHSHLFITSQVHLEPT